MVGSTLVEIREHIEALASDGGEYELRCARTGECPVPATGLRFPSRNTARSAARATEQYRAALRRYDPRAPYYDVIVCEVPSERSTPDHTSCIEETNWSLAEPVLAGKPSEPDERRRVSFCHDVTAAVFEALSAGGYDTVESNVMDAYFDLAERLSDPDDLCLCLLESMAAEVDAELDPRAQTVVLANAASRLGPIESDHDPLLATLERFEQLGLVGSYARTPWAIDADGTRSTDFDLGEYALSPCDGRLPILPVTLDLYRRRFDRHLTRVSATQTDDGWTITLELGTVGSPFGIACAPIEEGV